MRQRGFSLIELMVTVAVLAILVAIGLPSFQGSMRSNQVATGTNELLASMSLARSEAIRNPGGAGICATEEGEECGGNWNDGWMVWIDSNANGEPDEDERVVRYIEGSPRLNISEQNLGEHAESYRILFDTRGLANGDLRQIVLQPDNCPSNHELVRTLSLSAIGNVNVQRGACE